MKKIIKSYLTLKFVKEYFRDEVSGKMVCIYVDCYGEHWMKDDRWALFRIRCINPFN